MWLGWRLIQTPYTWIQDSVHRAIARLRFLIGVIRVIRGEIVVFLAEFLEGGIAVQRIPDGIESKKSRRNGRWTVKPPLVAIWRL